MPKTLSDRWLTSAFSLIALSLTWIGALIGFGLFLRFSWFFFQIGWGVL